MKRLIGIFLVLVFCFSFSACSNKETEKEKSLNSNEETTISYPTFKEGDVFNYKDLVNVEISRITPVKDNNSIVVSFKFTNISGEDIDVSRFKGFTDVYIGNPEKYETDECFKIISSEKRRDFINNEKREEEGILRTGAKMMALYEWTFVRDSSTFYQDFGEFLSSAEKITVSMDPWYLKSDSSAVKEDLYMFEFDFKDIYGVLTQIN